MLYILNNPNYPHLGLTKEQILRLWGELFYWAITVINFKPSSADDTKTKYELFFNKKPDFREIRLLPIGSILYIQKRSQNNNLDSNRTFWQKGIYIGPSLKVSGAIRVAHLTNNKIQIIVSSIFKSVTDGGDLNIYPIINRNVDPFSQPNTIMVPNAVRSPLLNLTNIPDEINSETTSNNSDDDDVSSTSSNQSLFKVRGVGGSRTNKKKKKKTKSEQKSDY
jgi:hypothetical protein